MLFQKCPSNQALVYRRTYQHGQSNIPPLLLRGGIIILNLLMIKPYYYLKSWGQLEQLALQQKEWRALVDDLTCHLQ